MKAALSNYVAVKVVRLVTFDNSLTLTKMPPDCSAADRRSPLASSPSVLRF